MTEFVSDVPIDDVAVRDTRVSSAIDEPLRAMILDMLADRAMTVGDVHAALADQGFERTENTIRHHVNELRDAGLIELARLEEGRGGTTKYYEANTIVLSYAIPDDAKARVNIMVEAIQPDVADIVDTLRRDHGDDIDAITADMAPCEHCRDQKYETYVLLTVLRRALVRSLQDE